MNKIAVRLTTEVYDMNSPNVTNIYPYEFSQNYRKLDVWGKKQIVIHDFYMESPSRVEIHWGGQHDTTNILYGNQTIDIPQPCTEIIFSLDPFHPVTLEASNDRIAEFEFELI